jgi:hypothetical protein
MECNICFGIYTSDINSDFRPCLIVPCGHGNCQKCLKGILKNDQKCPVCRQKIEKINVNYPLMEMIELIARASELKKEEDAKLLKLNQININKIKNTDRRTETEKVLIFIFVSKKSLYLLLV